MTEMCFSCAPLQDISRHNDTHRVVTFLGMNLADSDKFRLTTHLHYMACVMDNRMSSVSLLMCTDKISQQPFISTSSICS
jgi:hypothetical protein